MIFVLLYAEPRTDRCFYLKPPSLNLTELKHRAAILFCCLTAFLCSNAQNPVADFKTDISGGCSPIVVNFQDLSSGNPTSWYWDFGNGAFSTKQHPSTTYFTSGTYTVSLKVTNAAGSHTVTRNAYITVYIEPTADFAASKRNGCSPTPIQFTDQSVSPAGTSITKWKWDFGDGGSSTLQNPVYTYRSAGSFTVTLTITNDKGCTKLITKPNYIDIIPGVVPNFASSIPAVCRAPALIKFTNGSTGPGTISHSWDFGDGKTSSSHSPDHIYTKEGSYKVALVVSSSEGCSDTLRNEVIIGGFTTNFIVPQVCENTFGSLSDSSFPRPVSLLWQFPDGTTDTVRNPRKLFGAGGPYPVKLISTYETCQDSVTKTINVVRQPAVDFTATDTVRCQPSLTTKFKNLTNSAVKYVWDFGDSTTSTAVDPSHTYTVAGDYNIQLIATTAEGCSDTLRREAFVKIRKPVITFPAFPQRGCVPYTTKFQAAIQTVDTVLTYLWDFGDGNTSNQKEPSHTYPNQGTYTVKLTVTTSSGCTETLVMNTAVKVGTRQVADFDANVKDACASAGIQFVNKSTTPTDEWIWKFGDGGISGAQNPKHDFLLTGLMDVELVAVNNGCPSLPVVKKQFVNIRPSISKFEYKPDCNNRLQYQFTDMSIGAQTYLWDFGDGSPKSTAQDSLHTFPGRGSYVVTLTTTNGACSYTLPRTITIIDKTPTFRAADVEGCKPFSVRFEPTSPDPGAVFEYVWDFGNSVISNRPWHDPYGYAVYNNSGTYNVSVTAVDTFGCRDFASLNNYIRVFGSVPAFDARNNNGCVGLTAEFTDKTTTDGIHPVVSWRWDFGDSTTQTYTAPPFRHLYDSLGTYPVKLVVENSYGCADSVTYTNFVKTTTIKANWAATKESCPGAPVHFINLTKHPQYSSWWTFGDGTTSTNNSQVQVYKDTGYYSPMLKVRDQNGCEDSLVQQNYVYVGLPQASFTANNFATYCTPFEAKFKNTSTYYGSWFWNLKTATSTQHDPVNYYTSTGRYDIKLVVTSPGGCKDSVTRTLSVYNPQDSRMTYVPLHGGCRPFPVNFEAFTDMTATFVWDFGDGNVVDTTVHKIRHVYDNLGDFLPKIILKEPSGCMIPLTGTDTIAIIGAKINFLVNRNLLCDSGFVSLTDSTISRESITNYHWDFGDGSTSNDIRPAPHYYSQPGNYTIRLMVDTENGCADTMSIKPPVKVVQSPVINIVGDSVICLNDYVRYQGVNIPDTSAIAWAWRFPNGNSDNRELPVLQQYKTAGNFKVSLIATNSSGCADTATQDLLVHALPTVDMPKTVIRQAGFPITLPATYSTGVEKYVWSPVKGLDCTDCPQPEASPKFSTKYAVNFTDQNGCTNDAEIQVVVLCQNANVFVPNTFSPNGDGNNDVFYVRGKGLDRVKTIRIYNRWGETVFEKKDFAPNDAAAGWNGQFRGSKAQAGVYIYQVEVFCENGDVIRHEGNIALIH